MKSPFFDDEAILKKRTPPALKVAKALSVLMDSAFRIPFTKKTFGIDALVGAVPVLGDALTFLISGYLLTLAVYYKVPTSLVLKMLGNIAFDFLIGVVPILGDIFDVFFKANIRNYTLLFDFLETHRTDLFVEGKSAKPTVAPSDAVVDL
ncbi:MAG: DUF4112 domain-containing protein [Vampirovibrionales bacterium]|jgi:hypothetical protein|nr:DUF4112 domain-containing protein [Vampirovibrionales bacterium]